jgi:methyltransferase-like protein
MAQGLPGARFVGIELSTRQTAEGQALASELGLANIELRAADLLTVDGDSLGEFDYIVAHGVYSWVPKPVQEKILAVCERHLSPHGVAYINYNTYPGFYRRQYIGEMMRYHTSDIPAPAAVAQEAGELLAFLYRNTPQQDGVIARLLDEERQRLAPFPLGYLYHEYLSGPMGPCYLHEFMTRAKAHGFQYLDDAAMKVHLDALPEEVQGVLAQFADDVVQQQQYIDFIRSTMMRSTLLCRRDVPISTRPSPAVVAPLFVRGIAEPQSSAVDVHSEEGVKFRSRFGSATVESPRFKAMLMKLLHKRPQALSIPELAGELATAHHLPMAEDELCSMVLYAERVGLLRLHLRRPPSATTVPPRPRASTLARWQASHKEFASNLWHEPIDVQALWKQLIPLLDGRSDLEGLSEGLLGAVQRGTLVLREANGAVLTDLATARRVLMQALPMALEALLRDGFLEGP